jgi:hypothetical protein
MFLLLSFGILVSQVFAQAAKEKPAKAETTITGEIIDVKCYLTGMGEGRGGDHKQCAVDCINGGLPVGLLDEQTEKVYTIVPKKGMEGANKSLVRYVAERVKLTGTIVEKGGTRLFVFTRVEEAK